MMNDEEKERVKKVLEVFDAALFSENEAVKSALKELMVITLLSESGNKPVKQYLSKMHTETIRLDNEIKHLQSSVKMLISRQDYYSNEKEQSIRSWMDERYYDYRCRKMEIQKEHDRYISDQIFQRYNSEIDPNKNA